MPDRFSRDLTDEDALGQDVEDQSSGQSSAQSHDTSFANDTSRYDSEWDNTDHDFGTSSAALDWSCSNDFMSDLPAHGRETMMTDDNWEDWLDRRKSALQIASSSTVTLKATFDQVPDAEDTEDQSIPSTTPLERSPLHSPRSPVALTPFVEAVSPTSSLQSLLEREVISSDTLSHATASSAVLGTAASSTEPCQQPNHDLAVFGDGNPGDDSWLPHTGQRRESSEPCPVDSTVKRSSSIPKLKKKKIASAEKRTTLWTKTQPSWDQFGGSGSWSTGEEGCLGGF